MFREDPRRIRLLTDAALVLANLGILVGVFAFDWGVFNVLLMYWAESAIVGGFTFIKILLTGAPRAGLYAPFFVFHYGMFMLVHLVFLVVFFFPGGFFGFLMGDEPEYPDPVEYAPFLLGLVLSHGVSFVLSYKDAPNRERRPERVMAEPYGRIVAMHVTVLFGGVFIMFLGQPIWAVVLLLVVKTAVDLGAHERGAKRRWTPQEPAAAQPPLPPTALRSPAHAVEAPPHLGESSLRGTQGLRRRRSRRG